MRSKEHEEHQAHDEDDEPGREAGVTLDDNPGLEHDHATAEGEMMTALGSKGPAAASRREKRR